MAASVCLRMCYRASLVVAMACLLALMFLGQTVSAPEWLRQNVADRLELALDGHRIEFGDMRFVIRKGWRPRFGLSDVHVVDASGTPLLNLSHAEMSVAMRPLMNGQLRPKKITLSGVRATLRREADGSFSLEYGNGGQLREQAANLPDLIDNWEQMLLSGPMSTLNEFELTDLTLQYDDARIGRGWTVADGRVVLERDGDDLGLSTGFAVLSGRSYAATLEMRYDSSIVSKEAAFGITVSDMAADDIATQTPVLGWLAPLQAPISGALRGAIDPDGAVLPVRGVLRIGEGVLQPTPETAAVPFRSARSEFTYDPAGQVLTFEELSVDSAWGKGFVEGRAYLASSEEGRLTELVGQFNAEQLELNPAGFYAEPLVLDSASVDLQLKLAPYELTIGKAWVETAGTVMTLDGSVGAAPQGWQIALNGQVPEIDAARLTTMWPEVVVPKTLNWIRANVSAGRIFDIDWAVRGTPGQKPNLYADFEFDEADVRVVPTLPMMTGARGHFSLYDHRMVMTATQGWLLPDEGGEVDVAGSSFIIPDVRIGPETPALVQVSGTGTATSAMSLLNRPPLSVLEGTGLPVDMAQGRFEIGGTMALPLKDKLSFEEIKFNATGRAWDVSSDVLVPGYEMRADELDISASDQKVQIGGDGEISGIPGQVVWTQPLGANAWRGSRAEGTIELSQRVVETFEIGLPDYAVSGVGEGQFTLDLATGLPPRLRVTSDLAGIGLSEPALGYRKRPVSTGEFEVQVELGERILVDALVLRAAGLSATGRITVREDGGLDRATFGNVRLANWLNVRAEMRGRGPVAQPEIRILGGSFDLGNSSFGESTGAPSPPLTVVSLDRMQISETIALTNMVGQFETTGGLSGTFVARVNGGALISGRAVPQGAWSAFEITSSDAGGVFRDAGILEQGDGGDMLLKLVPVDDVPGQYDGDLVVKNTRVKRAPAIAAIVNSISVVGLFDELSGNGIQFSEVLARFRLSRDELVLASSSAVGPSIGMSMDGRYYIQADKLDMQGVVSPFYLLNAIGAVMTRRGEGLIGINFNLRGTSVDPRVAVNPLSALTPGALREIFRRPTPQVGKSANPGPVEPVEKRPTRRQVLSGEDR